MKTLLKCVLGLCLLIHTGCDFFAELQNCDADSAPPLETFYSDEFRDIVCGFKGVNPEEKVVNLVIKTQADYERYFNCSAPLPAVDFDKYFILAGSYRHLKCEEFYKYSV